MDETETVDPVTPGKWFASERFESNTSLELWFLQSNDAGRHWRRVARPCRARGSGWDYEFTGSLEFTDPNHGYVFCASLPGTSDDHLWRVVETHDGGYHWRAVFGTYWRIPNPPPGGSRTVGDKSNIGGGYDFGLMMNSNRPYITFVGGSSRAFYLSQDKGSHWEELRAPVPTGDCSPIGSINEVFSMRKVVFSCDHQSVAKHPNEELFSTWKTVDGGRNWRLLERRKY